MSQANKFRIDFSTIYVGDQVWLDDQPMVVMIKIPAGSEVLQGGRKITTQVHMVTLAPRNRSKSNPDCARTVTIDRIRTRSSKLIEKLGGTEFQTIFEVIAMSEAEILDWEPSNFANFEPTDAPPGSSEKIQVLKERLERGQPLWHEDDRVDYLGLTGIIRPRD